jgi:hypothetical protein
MRRALTIAAALAGAAAVAWLLASTAGTDRPDARTTAPGDGATTSPPPGVELSRAQERSANAGDSAAPLVTPSSTSPLDHPSAAGSASDFDATLAAVRRDPTKQSLASLLRDWRSGRRSREQDRAVDAALHALAGPALDSAAGRLLLEGDPTAAQRQGLTALLATSGTGAAVDYLLAAAAHTHLRAEALAALATVANPDALPPFARAIDAGAAAEVLAAIASSLRNMETEKARGLEAAVRAALER